MKLYTLLLCTSLLGFQGCNQTQADEPSQLLIKETKPEIEDISKTLPAAPLLKSLPQAQLEKHGPYWVDTARDCDGYPRMNLDTVSGLCVGLVATSDTPSKDGKAGLNFPRDILIPHPNDTFSNEVYVTDMGGWSENKGRLLLIDNGQIETVINGLNLPHSIEYGPDGIIYIAEADKITGLYIPPSRHDGFATAPLITDLPYKTNNKLHLHPLKAFTFQNEDTLWVNSGSISDRCQKSIKSGACQEASNTAAVLKYSKNGKQWTLIETATAKGLRNSMGLTTHESGTVLQAGNGSDYKDVNTPHEDLNIVNDAQFYGWPYCYDQEEADQDWVTSAFNCKKDNIKLQQPIELLPPHGAPLDLAYVPKGTLGFDSEKLIVPLHGYRKTGHRILMFDVDTKGLPTSKAIELVSGWTAKDTGPRGAPVGISVGPDGAIWGVEDKNKTIFRIAQDSFKSIEWNTTSNETDIKDDGTYAELQKDIFLTRCASCHEVFSHDPDTSLNELKTLGWLDENSTLLERISTKSPKQMPPEAPLSNLEIERIRKWVADYNVNSAKAATEVDPKP